jgi:DNA-binding CsgD family transcriptional regulator
VTPTALLHGLGDLVFILDREQRITAVYGEWIRSGRTPAARWLGKRMVEEWPKDIAALHTAMNSRALEGQVVVYDWEYPVPGSGRRMLTTITPMYDGGGVITGALRATRLLPDGTRALAAGGARLIDDGAVRRSSSPALVDRGAPPPDVMFRLSPREGLIAMMLLDAARTSHIARDLKISVHTVRQHIKNILRKLRVHSQEELLDLLRGKTRAAGRPRRGRSKNR